MENNNGQSLEQLIPDFYDIKSQADRYKKEADVINAEIKAVMREGVKAGESKEFIVGELKAVFMIQERSGMNSEKLLQRLKDLGLTEAIKTIEVPNETVLEDLIYNGKLDAGKIADCNETSYVDVLKVSPIKKKGAEKVGKGKGI